MKKHITLFNSLFLFLALGMPLLSLAGNGGEESQKKRTINKSYTVTANDKLEIENTFGNVKVLTWDKSEITVDIEIVANGPTDEKAQDIMDEISVKDIHNGNIIAFKTKVGDVHNNGNKRKNTDEDRAFYIDYTVHMPAANRLSLTNSFGKITLPDFNGEVTLSSKFGGLTTGKLKDVDAINVEFGKASIGDITNGKVSFKFNEQSSIASVNGNVKITTEFSKNVQFNVGNDIQDLSVFDSYSGVRLIVTKALSAEFDVHSSFGHFYNDSEFSIPEEREKGENDYGPHFDKDYSGKAGEGKAKIKIKSSFGNVRLSHTASSTGEGKSEIEVKHKDKDKNKNKDKHKNKNEDEDDDDKTTRV